MGAFNIWIDPKNVYSGYLNMGHSALAGNNTDPTAKGKQVGILMCPDVHMVPLYLD